MILPTSYLQLMRMQNMQIKDQKIAKGDQIFFSIHPPKTTNVRNRKKTVYFQHEFTNSIDTNNQWNKLSISNKTLTIQSLTPQTPLNNKLSSKSMRVQLISKTQQNNMKKVLIMYTSGGAGANQNFEIIRGFLKTKIAENQYFSDYKMHQNLEDRSFLVTPEQQNGTRILYKIEEFKNITLSININFQIIKQIAEKIYQNYKKYDAFIVLCGLDTICYVATIISFMLQNLSKLVIFTGGYFPISFMRNDTVNNLIESFAIISQAQNFQDVIIVSKNKGYRANRCIKMKQGDLNAISSANIDALVSVNIKIKFRQYLFLPTPAEQFRIWTDLSLKVGIIHYEILMSKEALEYILLNPAYEGFIIQTYASNTLPENIQILNLFKRIAEEKGKIFVTTSQSIYKINNSLKKVYLQEFCIYFGGDMTTEAALAKLSYLYSKNFTRNQIRRLLLTDMRGELTEIKNQNRFSFQNNSLIEIVTSSIKQFYPTNQYGNFISKIEDQVCDFVVKGQNPKDLQQIFKNTLNQTKNNEEIYSELISDLVNRNYLLHKAVKYKNQNLYKYFLTFNVNVNHLDECECSPLYYAVSQKDKKAIVYLSKKGGFVICPSDELFQMVVKEIKEDNASFFELLYHIEFKQTLPQQKNIEGRNVLHLCAILEAQKCLKYLLQKFKFNIKVRDIYGKLYVDYKRNS